MSVETASIDPLACLAALETPWCLRREPDGSHLAFLDFDEILALDSDRPEESLRELLAPRPATGLSFSGWVGFFSYEFLAGLAGLQCRAKRDLEMPGGWFGRPRSILRIGPERLEVEAASANRATELERMLASATDRPRQPSAEISRTRPATSTSRPTVGFSCRLARKSSTATSTR